VTAAAALGYRPDIDGLRAVAVLPVVMFHAGVGAMSGGYVGVDVFFVISGYLIALMLAGDLRRGRFSLVTFYERRVRRILPAFFVIILLCSVLASVLLPPADMINYARSAPSALCGRTCLRPPEDRSYSYESRTADRKTSCKLMLAKARREQFGQSSERGKLLVEQLELAIEYLEETQAEQETKAEIAAPEAAKQKRAQNPRPPRRPRSEIVQNLSHFRDAMGQVIQIDEAWIRDHLGEMVRGTVEETLNALLDAEADRLRRGPL
jgi:hypothetical protein